MTTVASPFVWYDLATSDLAAAQAFYGAVFGWTTSPGGAGGEPYVHIHAGDRQIGGMMNMPPHVAAMGAPPYWASYVWVEDVDATAARFQAAEGKLLFGPQDIPTVGRFAVVADPQGASLMLFRHSSGSARAEPVPRGTPGHFAWHELYAEDGAKAFAFYAAMFGWTGTRTHDMGPMGTYQLFATADGEVGGMMTRPPEVPRPCWNYYVSVAGIDAAVERVKAAGGQLTMGPHPVPSGEWIAQCRDPQGAHFAMVSPTR